jgi:hypothetical protein
MTDFSRRRIFIDDVNRSGFADDITASSDDEAVGEDGAKEVRASPG